MGCREERRTVLQSHLCCTSHNYSPFSKNALFVIGDWDNNCAGVSLKLGVLKSGHDAHNMWQWKKHNLHKPANHHLNAATFTVNQCVYYVLCVYTVAIMLLYGSPDHLSICLFKSAVRQMSILPSNCFISPNNLLLQPDVVTPVAVNSESSVSYMTQLLPSTTMPALFKSQHSLGLCEISQS